MDKATIKKHLVYLGIGTRKVDPSFKTNCRKGVSVQGKVGRVKLTFKQKSFLIGECTHKTVFLKNSELKLSVYSKKLHKDSMLLISKVGLEPTLS